MAKCWVLESNSSQSCCIHWSCLTVHHSLGIFTVPAEESADFDKSSEPPHRIKELSGESYSSSLALSQAENGRGAPLAADALF